MKNKLLTLGLAVLSALCVPHAVAQTNHAVLEQKIEHVFYRADDALAKEVETELAAALTAEPNYPALLYYAGFFEYAKTSALYRDKADKKTMRAAFEAADKKLAAVKGQPWQAEAEALRGMICGQLMGVGGSTMKLGPKMAELTTGALEEQPGSPRAKICRAVCYLNTPGMFGGDKAEAMKLFNSAVASLTKSDAKTGELSWGKAYAYAWLAQAKLQTGDLPGAREAAEQALALEPNYGWVKGILNGIEKREAKK